MELGDLLYFATASRHLPASRGLGGTGSKVHFVPINQTDGWLPVSHTCSNQVDMPKYTSFEQLDAKLRQAIGLAQQGGFQFG